MNLDEISELWSKDCNVDITDLANESLEVPKLHSKYYQHYCKESLIYKNIEKDYNQLLRAKTEYYLGRISDDELKQYGWEAFDLKILRPDLETYLQADSDLIKLLLKMAVQKEKVEFLKDIIKQIHNRTFMIKNAIEFIKFSSGS